MNFVETLGYISKILVILTIFIKFSSPFRKENLKKGGLTYIFIIIHIGSFILLNPRIEFTKYNYYKDYLL